MSFLSALEDSVDSPKAAYLQFITDRGRADYLAFAFVEDEDDIEFYQHVLCQFRHIGYFGCGGKSGVLEIYYHLRSHNQADGNLFIVDRDHEEPPFDPADVLRTEPYSWEAHLCTPNIVASFIQRKARPPLGVAHSAAVEERWRETLEHFREVVSRHAGLLRLRHAPGQGLGLGDIRFADEVVVVQGGAMVPCHGDITTIEQKVQQSALSHQEKQHLEQFVQSSLDKCPSRVGHGKALFSIVRKFLPVAIQDLDRAPIAGVNSPKQLLLATPWDHPDFDYIRAYAAARISHNDNGITPITTPA